MYTLQRYDYMYSRLGEGEGFKVGIIPYRDIPLMFLHDVEVKPGSATSIVVHPQITRTSEAARERLKKRSLIKALFIEVKMFLIGSNPRIEDATSKRNLKQIQILALGEETGTSETNLIPVYQII